VDELKQVSFLLGQTLPSKTRAPENNINLEQVEQYKKSTLTFSRELNKIHREFQDLLFESGVKKEKFQSPKQSHSRKPSR